MKFCKLASSILVLVTASMCFAQMYTLTDLSDQGQESYPRAGINARGQEAGIFWYWQNDSYIYSAFRTAPNSPITHPADDLGALGGTLSYAIGINASGQVIGTAQLGDNTSHAFRTAPNSPINLATDDLGAVGVTAINDFGQVAGCCLPNSHAFRTAGNRPINPATDDLGTLGGTSSYPTGINNAGQVVGVSTIAGDSEYHLFRTKPNRAINPATDDLGPIYGSMSAVINTLGQVAGCCLPNNHAFLLPPTGRINPGTKDLGGNISPMAIDSYGQVVGFSDRAFLYSNGKLHDLSTLISESWALSFSTGINDAGQISLTAAVSCGIGCNIGPYRAAVLNPIYRASVQPPIKNDGSSVFRADRGLLSIKFTLLQRDARTCNLPPATISLIRIAGGAIQSVADNHDSTDASPLGTRIGHSDCQYVFPLNTRSLKVGTYRVDICISGIMVGHAVFALR